jgi:hypothetical protein
MLKIAPALCFALALTGCSCFTSTPGAACTAYANAAAGGAALMPPPPPPTPLPVRTTCTRYGNQVYCDTR